MSEQFSSINWKSEEVIALPGPGRERRMAIRRTDWTRVKRRLSRSDSSAPRLAILYSILFGVAATSGSSILPIVEADGLPAWVAPAYVIVAAFSLIGAIVTVWVDGKLREGEESTVTECLTDMEEIENIFETGED